LSESRRKKLEMLIRSLSSGDVKGAEDVLRRTRQFASRPPAGPRPPVSLQQAAPGTEASTPNGKFWLIRRSGTTRPCFAGPDIDSTSW